MEVHNCQCGENLRVALYSMACLGVQITMCLSSSVADKHLGGMAAGTAGTLIDENRLPTSGEAFLSAGAAAAGAARREPVNRRPATKPAPRRTRGFFMGKRAELPRRCMKRQSAFR